MQKKKNKQTNKQTNKTKTKQTNKNTNQNKTKNKQKQNKTKQTKKKEMKQNQKSYFATSDSFCLSHHKCLLRNYTWFLHSSQLADIKTKCLLFLKLYLVLHSVQLEDVQPEIFKSILIPI